MTYITKLSPSQQKQVEEKLEEKFTLYKSEFPEYLPFVKQGIKSIVAVVSDDNLGVMNITLTMYGANDVCLIRYNGWSRMVTGNIANSSEAAELRAFANSPMLSGDDILFGHVMNYLARGRYN